MGGGFCWNWFYATGDPVAYVLYRAAQQREETPPDGW